VLFVVIPGAYRHQSRNAMSRRRPALTANQWTLTLAIANHPLEAVVGQHNCADPVTDDDGFVSRTVERRYRHRCGTGARIVLAAQHLFQIGDIRSRLVRRQIGLHDGFGLGKAALKANHQTQSSAAPAHRLWCWRKPCGGFLPPSQKSWKEHRRGRDWTGTDGSSGAIFSAGVIAARFVVPAELIERGPCTDKIPSRDYRRMGAGEDIEGLLENCVIASARP